MEHKHVIRPQEQVSAISMIYAIEHIPMFVGAAPHMIKCLIPQSWCLSACLNDNSNNSKLMTQNTTHWMQLAHKMKLGAQGHA